MLAVEPLVFGDLVPVVYQVVQESVHAVQLLLPEQQTVVDGGGVHGQRDLRLLREPRHVPPHLVAARLLYENKVESYKVAKMRVDAIDLFTQSGRSSMRDTLEAARDLLSAQNALCSAVVDWRMSDLGLRTTLGNLRVRPDGTWDF